MKKLVALLLVTMMLFTQVGVMAQTENDTLASSIKILAIGNSFSVDSMEWLYDVLTDLGVEEVILGNLYIGGCSLKSHAKNAGDGAEKYTYYKCSAETEGKWESVDKKSLMYGLCDEDWDYISLQQVSGQSGRVSSYEPHLTELIEFVKANRTNPDAKLMWNMTWAYQGDSTHGDFAKYANNQDVMYRAIVNATKANIVGNESFDYIIPCGTAVQNMRTSEIGDVLTRDGYHMNKVFGRYLLGVMWAKVITGGAELDSLKTFPGKEGEITPLMVDIICESVENAYENPFEVTNSSHRATGDNTDYAKRIANCFVDVTDQGTYYEPTGIFTFNHNGVVARNGKDIAYLGTQAASLNGQPCAYIDGRFYVPQAFIDYKDGRKEFAPLESETFDVEMTVEKNRDGWQSYIGVVTYLTGVNVAGTIKFTAPQELKDLEIELEHEAGISTGVTFDIPEIKTDGNYYDFAFDFTTNGKIYSYDFTKEISFAKKADGITVDGVMTDGEWDDAYVITCDKESQATNLTDWAGKTDLNAKTYVAWDDENIYFAGVTEDNNFTGPAKESLPWEGDSVQLAIFHDKGINAFAPGNASSDFHEIAISLFDGKASVYKSKAQTGDTKTGLIEKANAVVVNNGTKTVYEFSMTWKDLFGYEYTPEGDHILGFSVLYNDNDGDGRRGWIEYGGGIGGTKDANDFAQMYLVGVNEVSLNEIKVYVNGRRLSFDQPPVLLNDRTLVPVRAIFEELGAVVMWNDSTQTALAVKDDLQITIKIGVDVMMANDKEIALDVPAQLINDRTLVPLRAIAEALGNTVKWYDATQTVTITD